MVKQWLLKHALGKNKNSFAYKMRKRRMQIFEDLFESFFHKEIKCNTTITLLDIGGEFEYWQSIGFKYLDNVDITLLNISEPKNSGKYGNIHYVKGDATNLERYADKEFDLCFSNSVIEHVGGFDAQQKMAKEMRRVGKHGYLQTPNKYFVIEPHYLFPLFQFFPTKLKMFFFLHFQMGSTPKAKNEKEAYTLANEVRLLSKKELSKLFPGIHIHKEKIGPLTKSFFLYF